MTMIASPFLRSLFVSGALALAAVAAAPAAPALADDDGYIHSDGYTRDREDGHGHDHDHDRARRAVEAGQVLPLAEILTRLESVAPGRVIETELEYDDGRYIYEFTLVAPDGRLLEAEVDAATGRLIELEDEH
jgi:uncharacterized membrane protein YkoI